MKYYFCIMSPYEFIDITEYDSLDELKKDNEFHINNYYDWRVIKGEYIDL